MLIPIVFFTAIGLGLLVPWLAISALTFFQSLERGHRPAIQLEDWLFIWVWFLAGATSLAFAGASWYYW